MHAIIERAFKIVIVINTITGYWIDTPAVQETEQDHTASEQPSPALWLQVPCCLWHVPLFLKTEGVIFQTEPIGHTAAVS